MYTTKTLPSSVDYLTIKQPSIQPFVTFQKCRKAKTDQNCILVITRLYDMFHWANFGWIDDGHTYSPVQNIHKHFLRTRNLDITKNIHETYKYHRNWDNQNMTRTVLYVNPKYKDPGERRGPLILGYFLISFIHNFQKQFWDL